MLQAYFIKEEIFIDLSFIYDNSAMEGKHACVT